MEIVFIGDIMIGRLVNEALKVTAPSYPWGNVLPILRHADIRIGNLECVISDRGKPVPKVFNFRTDSKNIEVLKMADINAVSLANNHILDYGQEALFDTLNFLDLAGIKHAGAGRSLAEAQMPAYLNSSGYKIVFFSATDNEPTWAATRSSAGIWYMPFTLSNWRAKALLTQVQSAKKQNNLVIVSLHWGSNWGYEPAKEHIAFAHKLIDFGADVVAGHSPHVFRGIEIYKKRPVLYSLGDFIDDYAVNDEERNDESFIFALHIRQNRFIEIRLYPTIIEHFQALLAPVERQKDIVYKMQKLCGDFGTKTRWDEKNKYLTVKII